MRRKIITTVTAAVALVALTATATLAATARDSAPKGHTTMTNPGSIARTVPDGPDWLVRAVRDLQRQVSSLSTATPKGALRVVSGHDDSIDYSLTKNVWKTLSTVTIAVPPGFTQAVVNATGNVTATNLQTQGDFFEAQVSVNGSLNGHAPCSSWALANGGEAAATAGAAQLVDVEGVPTITVQLQASAFLGNWPSGGAPSGANLDVVAIFIR